MDLTEIIFKVPDETDRALLDSIRSEHIWEGHNAQAQTILQMRMIDRLIVSLDKNSNSSDRLAHGLNWLTGIIAFAGIVAAFASIVQLCK
jgi:hypothetical protein